MRDVLERKRPELLSLDVLVFPGRTLVADTLPRWVPKACGDRVVAIETVFPAVADAAKGNKSGGDDDELPWATYVLAGGVTVVSGVEQIVVRNSAGGYVSAECYVDGKRWDRRRASPVEVNDHARVLIFEIPPPSERSA